jgi:Ca-activated chloride channel family protein
VAAAGNKEVAGEEHAVVLTDDAEKAGQVLEGLRRETAKKPALGTIVVPHVEFEETSLREAVDVLRRRSRELDPDGRGVDIAMAPAGNSDAWETPVTFSMDNVPVGDVLRYLALATGATLRVDGETVEVVPPEIEPEDAPVPPPGEVTVNPFVMAAKDRFSTFALDTDTASYSMARNEILNNGFLPAPHTVRVEEFVNSFDYNYPRRGTRTFSIHAEGAPSPFRPGLALLKIGVRGKVIGRDGLRPSHLVFVVDASGSMGKPDRMPLVQLSLGVLTEQLQPGDLVSIVAYGSTPALVAEAVPVSEKTRILQAVEGLQCTGSTNLFDGLELGYRVAARYFLPQGNNRIILCSDGVANVGETEAQGMLRRVDAYRAQGISLTAAGFGAGVYNDSLLETLANKGDGNYVFIDSEAEARRVFETAMAGTLQMIAKDAKIQVEFNPERVRRYRLLGYENRDIADKDFRNDAIDAGEVGSGQSATALYELELIGDPRDPDLPDPGTVYVRYRDLETDKVEEISTRILNSAIRPREPETDPRYFLAACAAELAEVLRGSPYAAESSPSTVAQVADRVAAGLPLDPRVQEFLQVVTAAEGLPRRR